jgi:hypothetical protein
VTARRARPRGRAVCAAIALAAIAVAVPPPTRADDAAPPEASRQAAAAAFAEGERAFAAGDYGHAADAFEAAYRAAPHPDALWNAARAHHRAGERARAANLYARYLRTAPPGAKDRDAATTALRELAERLGRLDVVAPGATEVTIDGGPWDGASLYVHPGSHVVRARVGDRVIVRAPAVEAGGVVSVALVDEPPPAPAPAPAPPPAAAAAPAPLPAPRPTTPPPPGPRPALVVASVGGGLTAIAAGVLLWSGVDTLNARSAYDGLPAGSHTQEIIDAGHAKQDRTNVLVGVTAGLGALTAAGTIWLFATSPRAEGTASRGLRLGVAGSGASLAGSF